jgi:hypothetical protein
LVPPLTSRASAAFSTSHGAMLDSDDEEFIDEQSYWEKYSRQLRAGFQILEAEKRGDIRPTKRRKVCMLAYINESNDV